MRPNGFYRACRFLPANSDSPDLERSPTWRIVIEKTLSTLWRSGVALADALNLRAMEE